MANKKPSEKSHCPDCLYFNNEDNSCVAYPLGIPDKYLNTDAKHTKPDKAQVVSAVFQQKPMEY